jgi:hypothetical protein
MLPAQVLWQGCEARSPFHSYQLLPQTSLHIAAWLHARHHLQQGSLFVLYQTLGGAAWHAQTVANPWQLTVEQNETLSTRHCLVYDGGFHEAADQHLQLLAPAELLP